MKISIKFLFGVAIGLISVRGVTGSLSLRKPASKQEKIRLHPKLNISGIFETPEDEETIVAGKVDGKEKKDERLLQVPEYSPVGTGFCLDSAYEDYDYTQTQDPTATASADACAVYCDSNFGDSVNPNFRLVGFSVYYGLNGCLCDFDSGRSKDPPGINEYGDGTGFAVYAGGPPTATCYKFTPSQSPSNRPSNSPSDMPTDTPTLLPSEMTSDNPTLLPSDMPSKDPSVIPSVAPSVTLEDEIIFEAPSTTPSMTTISVSSRSPTKLTMPEKLMPSKGKSFAKEKMKKAKSFAKADEHPWSINQFENNTDLENATNIFD